MEVWADLSPPLSLKFRICGAILPVPYVPSQGQLYLYIILTQPKIMVLQNNNLWSGLICVCWGVWLGPGSAVGQRNQSLCQGWPQMEGQGEWLDDLSYLYEGYLGFKLFCHIHTFHMKYVVWMHSDIMFVIFVCMFYPWQYRVVWKKLLVWKVIPIQHITLGFIQVPEQTLCTEGLHIQISLLKNYVLQSAPLLPIHHCNLAVKLHRNASRIATVSYWIWAVSFLVVWRCANIFSLKYPPQQVVWSCWVGWLWWPLHITKWRNGVIGK